MVRLPATRDEAAKWIAGYGGLYRGRKYPRLAVGDAEKLLQVAEPVWFDDRGRVIDEDLDEDSRWLVTLAEQAEEAISDYQDQKDAEADRETLQSTRETRDESIEEFTDALRARLLPEVHAAEQEELQASYQEELTRLGL